MQASAARVAHQTLIRLWWRTPVALEGRGLLTRARTTIVCMLSTVKDITESEVRVQSRPGTVGADVVSCLCC
jgi:hypothetical protein